MPPPPPPKPKEKPSKVHETVWAYEEHGDHGTWSEAMITSVRDRQPHRKIILTPRCARLSYQPHRPEPRIPSGGLKL